MRRWGWALGGLLVGLALGRALPVASAADDPYAGLDIYARVLGQIQRSALSAPSLTDLVYASLRGMAASIDAHTAFYDPAAWRRLEEEAAGAWIGIGAATETAACGQRVTRIVPGGPAERAGIPVEACLVAIDGTPLAGMDGERASALLRGEVDTEAALTVEHEGERWRVAVLRARVVEASVEVAAAPEGVRLIRIRSIREHTADELRAAAAGASDIVLDLRGTPGGRLGGAVAIVDLFVGEGPVVRTEGRGPGSTRAWTAGSTSDDLAVPLVVLVDEGTASAAEIVAGALQDRGRARLVGRPTWGKGTVQSLFRYEDGSALSLTDARWILPGGRSPTRGDGLRPDVITEAADDVATAVREVRRGSGGR